jgi:NAD(P)-dependent dehydrogenase (short-subunit alcohol dehydrogenase family)
VGRLEGRVAVVNGLDAEGWDLVLDANVRTAFHATLAAVGHMRESAKRETAERGTPGDYRTMALMPPPVTDGQLGT